MSDIALLDPTTAAAARLHHGVLELAGRLGHLLGDDHEAAGFLSALGEQAGPGAAGPHPIDRLAVGLGLARAEIDVVLFAGAAEEHEGLASVLRGLHPGHLPVATCGLVAALAEAGLLHDAPDDPVEARLWARSLLTGALDVVLVQGDGPFSERGLILPEGLWTALRGDPGWPAGAREIDTGTIGPLGLRAEQLSAALVACANGVPATVVVDGAGDPVGAAMRLTPLLAGGGANPVVLTVPTLPIAAGRAITLAALARGTTPVLVTDDLPDGVAALDAVPAPSVLVTSGPVRIGTTSRAVLPVRVPPPSRAQRRQLWARLTPDCPDAAEVVPPGCGVAVATELARDAATAALLSGTHVRQRDLRAALDIRGGDRTPAGVQRIRPVAGWDDLVLPEDRLTQLHEAVTRVRAQDVVIGRWGFLADRPGRYGVRALFCGPPGTGKTLAAEVLAGATRPRSARGRPVADDVQVDRGDREEPRRGVRRGRARRRRAAVRRGRRPVRQAHRGRRRARPVREPRDRLSAVAAERFDGVAVLATNLRHNIDPAFTRRLEFVVAFDPPEEELRFRCGARHLPAGRAARGRRGPRCARARYR